jgi:phosphomannomutase
MNTQATMTDTNSPTTNSQQPTAIKFGTDGWRAIIADDFTFENVRRVAGAIAAYVLKHEQPSRGLIVGYDTRFGSPWFARAAAEILAGAGIPVRLANDYTPTPAISYAVKNYGAAGGVVITSSHNPWNWNGVKFKAKFGGSATPAIMKMIEEEVIAGAMPSGKKAAIEETDLKPAYIRAVCRFADLDLIRKAGFRLAVDSMYGSGRGVLTRIFEEHGTEFIAIRQEINPLFPDINPEPIEPHARMLQETVVREGCHAGLATDGDAAALWTRTRFFRCCWNGCCDVSSGRVRLCARSIPRACSTASRRSMAAS